MKKTTLTVALLLLSSSAFAKSWSSNSSPYYLLADWNLKHVETQLHQLPLDGSVPTERMPWASSYIPNQRNSFRYRPHAVQSLSFEKQMELFDHLDTLFNLKRPQSFAQFKAMSEKERNELSPVEKYSIFIGDYTYALSRAFPETDPEDLYWTGYCDAWSMAAMQNSEPDSKTVMVGDVPLTFTSGDLKILLTGNAYLSLQNNEPESITIGSRCKEKIAQIEPGRETSETDELLEDNLEQYLRSPKFGLTDSKVKRAMSAAKSSKCEDVNAGTFHIVIGNQLGLAKKGFVFDLNRDIEIWNQPAGAYHTEITPVSGIAKDSARGTTRNVKVKTTLTYADDTFYGWSFSSPTLKPNQSFMNEYEAYEKVLIARGEKTTMGTYPEDLMEHITYEYLLDLNANDEIIGGTWLTYDRPDYIWIPNQVGFDRNLSKLPQLLKP